mgnify:CR=1 FL=1
MSIALPVIGVTMLVSVNVATLALGMHAEFAWDVKAIRAVSVFLAGATFGILFLKWKKYLIKERIVYI